MGNALDRFDGNDGEDLPDKEIRIVRRLTRELLPAIGDVAAILHR